MSPKKKAAAKGSASASTKPEPEASAVNSTNDALASEDAPGTETAEPPKHDAQPAKGDPNANAANEEKTGETTEDAKLSSDDVTENGIKAKDLVTKKIERESTKSTKKRKNAAEPKKPAKVPREGSRSSARGRASKSDLSNEQLLRYLLSTDAEELLRPDNEKDYVKQHPNNRTYSSSALNPFEELMCAMILSRPVSHGLGHRAIRTVLNDPYDFTSAQAVKDAGEEKVAQALYDAKTQHKDKTAAQISQFAETVVEKYTSDGKEGTTLSKALSDNEDDASLALKSLKNEIKGFGDTGIDIFLRRVQWLEPWTSSYPFVDGKSQDALRALGLPQDHEDLKQVLEEHWSKLGTTHLAGKDNDQKKRRAFVVLLERVTTAKLDNKENEVREAAANSA
ncbi:uncharacterized protein CLAFUR5_01096 [Fulvia fulva]|uniref:Uncharacterized protein n=1 Tax=Passalora fulva TaxID=5499 RepID=A0A9Q8L8N5_PASFU|nr:uncharacterized protein CLAFUR5_01096 [Fulvia fulva]UJO12966.1 hypothetical protein CLAFUR5_01096 [Fulvia fulva]